ncbi:hypothetical protein M5K25_015939 [Dendrobium thyrsiflorum]|uniref:RRM domain-containing protein n=1 Tax=Dendrobium thyrsiflorum TaxID=117978 RepID=A0ABD0URM2_DENTH
MSRVYVGNLEPLVSERDLEDEFRVYGVIRSIWVARRPPGYSFIDFDDRRDAEDAIREMDGATAHVIGLQDAVACHLTVVGATAGHLHIPMAMVLVMGDAGAGAGAAGAGVKLIISTKNVTFVYFLLVEEASSCFNKCCLLHLVTSMLAIFVMTFLPRIHQSRTGNATLLFSEDLLQIGQRGSATNLLLMKPVLLLLFDTEIAAMISAPFYNATNRSSHFVASSKHIIAVTSFSKVAVWHLSKVLFVI